MKKIGLIVLMTLISISVVFGQRCAVLEFKAGAGISQADVDGISAIFITHFHPAGYTMVERTQIDKAIDEQGFQRSRMTESQMVRIGEILNVSKIVIGDVNLVMNQYNVDVRVINVETGTIAATEGAAFAGSSYRASMQSIAQKLASKIAITAAGSVNASSTGSSKTRTSVEVLYGYLKIFPHELGVFQSEPTSVINQINSQAQHGYNNWRIPTNEELSLLRANNYLGGGEYMSRENKRGVVLLVTDGNDFSTVQAEEQARRVREEQERKRAEQERIKAEQERKAMLKAQGWVDLGLPSGTLWKNKNEGGNDGKKLYKMKEAWNQFRGSLPTEAQFQELFSYCSWDWTGSGYKVTGPNFESIYFPAAGYTDGGYVLGSFDGRSGFETDGCYWASPMNLENGQGKWIQFDSTGKFQVGTINGGYSWNMYCRSVRLVK